MNNDTDTYIHNVNKPFFSRLGQFEPDKQSLTVGIATSVLQNHKIIRVYLGDNRRIYYEIGSTFALEKAEEYKSLWTNKDGKKVAMLPLKDFYRFDKDK